MTVAGTSLIVDGAYEIRTGPRLLGGLTISSACALPDNRESAPDGTC